MYEHQVYTAILNRMLERVPDDVDKREGSIIYDALAPAAAELAELYASLDANQDLLFADTATGEYLSRRTAEFGVIRKEATAAVRRGLFYNSGGLAFDVPGGSRYTIGGIIYRVIGRTGVGQYELLCETPGIIGNQHFGEMQPVDYINGLAQAALSDVLIPGQEEETEEALRSRYFAIVNEPAFGGNESDYRQRISAMDGAGACKVYPAWDGGGTVKVTIIAADWSAPSPTLISDVQTAADPEVNSGQGLGFAPIGHRVTVAGVTNVTVNVATRLTLGLGITVGEVQADVEEAIAAYLANLRSVWDDVSQIVVRIAQVDARILSVQGVVDVSDTELNGSMTNLTLQSDEIPVLGAVTINE